VCQARPPLFCCAKMKNEGGRFLTFSTFEVFLQILWIKYHVPSPNGYYAISLETRCINFLEEKLLHSCWSLVSYTSRRSEEYVLSGYQVTKKRVTKLHYHRPLPGIFILRFSMVNLHHDACDVIRTVPRVGQFRQLQGRCLGPFCCSHKWNNILVGKKT
jgi:hypothetical protein